MGDGVCKMFLVGFCPASLLKKVEHVEPCRLLHSIALREELEKHPQADKHRRDYEDALLRKLEGLCAEADARASREKRKCRPAETVVKLPEHLKIKAQAYEEARNERVAEAEAKGRAGDIEGSKMAMRSAEQAQRDIDGIRGAHTSEFPGESVCKACGVRFLNGSAPVRNNERMKDKEGEIWEEDHMASKGHKGYVQLRQKLAEMRQARREAQERPRAPSAAKDRREAETRSRSRRREKEKGGEKK
eukprot:CAMPEP_0176150758 /NCGR_PEP_ID=MMETSP0120_2-20121206/76983_1 /TAXON_ID=160619 /ORGANISM="Kryptoperidinium foliaceum, Strain CCMP 1326" /LENGTH=245 /DNA_ID=CAMNT_0017487699 /DNA_START=1 /DNA_END=735 /DNA_ORIENTATION=+